MKTLMALLLAALVVAILLAALISYLTRPVKSGKKEEHIDQPETEEPETEKPKRKGFRGYEGGGKKGRFRTGGKDNHRQL